MGSYEESREEWCARTFNLVDADAGPVVRWVVEGRDASVERWRVVGQVLRPKDCASLVQSIEREFANSECRFGRVLAWQHGAKNQFATKKWIERSDYDARDDDDELDGSPRSMLALLLHHVRFLQQQNTATSAAALRYSGETIDKLRAENDRLRDERIKRIELEQDLLDRSQDREVRAIRQVTLSKAAEAVMGIAQYKLTGGRIGPHHPDILARTLSDFAASLTPEQMEELGRVLRPEQAMPLFGLLYDPATFAGTQPKALGPVSATSTSGPEATPEQGGDKEEEEAEPAEPQETTRAELTADVLGKLRQLLPPEAYTAVLAFLREVLLGGRSAAAEAPTNPGDEPSPSTASTTNGNAEQPAASGTNSRERQPPRRKRR